MGHCVGLTSSCGEVCRHSTQRSQQPLRGQHSLQDRPRNLIFQQTAGSGIVCHIQALLGITLEGKQMQQTPFELSLCPKIWLAWLRGERHLWFETLKQISKFSGEKKKASARFGSTYTKIGTIQRRLAWPLRKDDTQIREAFHIFKTALRLGENNSK